MQVMTPRWDVVVVGAGPAGASCALWLSRAGWDVALVERKRFPRPKTCGDGLTPRAVRQLQDMGLGLALESHHRYEGLRAVAKRKVLELSWPEHPAFPSHGYVVTRSDLDEIVARKAVTSGATLLEGADATPLLEGGRLGGVVVARKGGRVEELRARYVVVADGANSRFGRSLGAARNRDWPLGTAMRGYWSSQRSEETWIESHLDLHSLEGSTVPGYGWVFPLGDGRVNVGVGLLSSSPRWRGTNTTRLLADFVDQVKTSWGLSAQPLGDPTGGKLPMGLSVGPRVGERYVLVGDAGGGINPFNGEGIAYGYETGRLAAWAVGRALSESDPSVLHAYEDRLSELYGPYYSLGRRFVGLIGQPEVLSGLLSVGMRSPALMRYALRLMANLQDVQHKGPGEAAAAALEQLSAQLDAMAATAAKASRAARAVTSSSISPWERLGKSAS